MSNVITKTDEMTEIGQCINNAYERTKCGHREWIEGSLDFAAALVRARDKFGSDNNAFSEWLIKNKHDHVSHQDRAALIGLGRDLKLAREALEKTTRNSYQHIWAEEKHRFPEKKSVTHVSKTPSNRPKPQNPRSNSPPSGPRAWGAKNPLFGRDRGEEINAMLLNKNGSWTVSQLLKQPGCEEIWVMMLQCYDAGFLTETRYYANIGQDTCTLRLLFPEAPSAYTSKFDLANAKQRQYVRDVIIPAALAAGNELIVDPSKLEQIVKAYGNGKTLPAKTPLASVKAQLAPVKSTPAPVSMSVKPAVMSEAAYLASIGKPKYLSQQEVDPEFTGTPIEFIDIYGHVQIWNAEKFATMRFTYLTDNFRDLAKFWNQKIEPEREKRPIVHKWLRSPDARDVKRLEEAMELLRPQFAEAETVLAIAKAALKSNKKDS